MRRVFPAPIETISWDRKQSRRRPAQSSGAALIPGKKLNVVPAEELAARASLLAGPGGPPRTMTVVPMPVNYSRSAVIRETKDKQAGKVLGTIAWVCVGLWWLNGLMSVASTTLIGRPASVWATAAWPLLFVALIGSHLTTAISFSFLRSGDVWGPRAVWAFWLSLLIWVPLGWLFSALAGILAG
jgi:hypothetical protein